MDIILILTVALAVEFTIGDPPNALHPVAWLGRIIALIQAPGLRMSRKLQFIYGVLITIGLTVGIAGATWLLIGWLKDINYALYVISAGILLKMSFSFVYLRRTALNINKLIENDDTLDKGRFELRALVSRDTSKLSRPHLVSATVESVSESLCDSLVSPVFFFLLAGLPGAFAFRVVSTFDSMIGYHGKFEYLGKFPARLDDVLNYIPARISALIVIIAAGFTKMGAGNAWRIAKRDHKKTESPNAGWPMAAAAGALGVQFEKLDHYQLGTPERPMTSSVVEDSLRLINGATLVWFIICYAVGGLIIAFT